ncbi:MAG: putative TetR family transcriptional regulator, partial [Acidimicrobiales bacterium]|nr:putative TetR family transcriptional regulator [Acidimicrobiales bacterium]
MTVERDGRRARREQNRGAVLDALAELYREGVYEPSAAQIAERAGLSSRSLFRYFDDVDDLNRATIDQQLARARPLLAVDARPDDPAARKVERLVDARLRLHEAIAPA